MKIPVLITRTVIASAATLLLASCGGERINDPVTVTEGSLSTAITQALDYSVLPAVNVFNTASNNLLSASEAFCSAPSASLLSNAQAQWKTTATAWFRLAPYRFGPLNDDPVLPEYIYIDSLRLRGTDYTATVRTDIETAISDSSTLDDAYFAAKNFQKVGLLALEITLFETVDTKSTTTSDIVTEFTNTERKCQVLTGLATQLSNRATRVSEQWNNDYDETGNSYRTTFIAGELSDGTEPLTLLITSVQEYLDYLQQRDVVAITAQKAGIAWPLVEASINEIEQLFSGTDTTTVSFRALMQTSGYQSEIAAVDDNIQAAYDAITAKDSVLFSVAAAALDGNFKREIPDGLEVELGINFTDGD